MLFYIYIISLYLFVVKKDTLILSQLSFIAFAGVTAFYLLARGNFHIGKPMAFAYLSCGWMFATVLWAYSRYYAIVRVKTMWQIFILFFLVYNLFCNDKDAHKKLVKALYTAGVAFIVYTVYTYGIKGIIDSLTGGEMQRLGSKISQENVFGTQHATTAMIAIFYLLYHKKHKTFHLIVLASSFICAMSSGSRKALLIVIAGGLYLIYKRYGIKQLYKTVFVGAVMGMVFITVIQLPMFETIRIRTEQGINSIMGKGSGDESTRQRLSYIRNGFNLFKSRPIHGYGADNFAIASGTGTYAHNNFTEVMVDFGAVGFLLYYAMYIIAFNRLRKNSNTYSKFLFVLFVVYIFMETAVVTYFDKLQWILFAFFMMDNAKLQKDSTDKGDKNEDDFKKIEESI